VFLYAAIAGAVFAAEPPSLPTRAAIDARVAQAMVSTQAQGMAVAVIDGGRIVHVQAYGIRAIALVVGDDENDVGPGRGDGEGDGEDEKNGKDAGEK